MTADKRAEAAEVEALFDCECGHSIDEHNGLGCYARLSYGPLVKCECPLTDDRTYGELLAPRLARRLAGARAEALLEAADAVQDECRHSTGACFCGSADWLRARAAAEQAQP